MAISNSGKWKDNLNFRAAEKNKERVKAQYVLASQSVEFSIAGGEKIQMLTTSCRSLTLPIHGIFESLGL